VPLREGGAGLIAEAIELLREADQLHRRFFTFALGASGPCWSPPVDIVETGRTLIVRVALPGVDPQALEVSTEGASLHVRAVRALEAGPAETIHMLEIPYGCFERRIRLPPGRYEVDARDLIHGCLVLRLTRLA
jgi:HSP20 family molecular chaperone IbpA